MLPSAQQARTAVDLTSVDDPFCLQALGRLKDAKLDVGVWETTSDAAVASFRCMIVDKDQDVGHIGIGDGCHNHRGIALLRALTEAAQTRMTYVSGSRDDISPAEFEDSELKRKCDYVRGLIGGEGSVRLFSDAPHFDSKDFKEDEQHLINRLNAIGCDEVLFVDLSREEFPIAVARVVVPGLEAPNDDDGYCKGARALAFEQGLV